MVATRPTPADARIDAVAGASENARPGLQWWERLETWVGVGVVAACCAFVLFQLHPDLVLRNTTPTGGDIGAHVWWPAYLRDHLLPEFDRPFAALLDDLCLRGLLSETLVVVTSEMGRKPRIGDPRSGGPGGAGRDHWTACMSVLLAGGGVRGGQVVGSSDGQGAYPRERPVHIGELAASLYHALGVDPRAQLHDIQGQLRFICDGNPVMELFR